ncbi:MAG: ketopantoate reductase family protein [Hyphomicrobiales bacterium]
MKIGVVGTGANGSCIAADLSQAGLDVSLIDQWPEHVETMRKCGLTIVMPEETINTKVKAYHLCDVCTFNEKFDVIFIVVKAYDTKWVSTLIEPYLKEDGLMIGLQNCMTAEIINEVVGAKRNLAAVVELSSEIFKPGQVKRNTPPSGSWFGVGSLTADMDNRIPEILELLKYSGKVAHTENILSAKWMKLIVNAMTMGPRSILGLRAVEAMNVDGMRELALKIGEEALLIGQKMGFRPEPIFGLKQKDIEQSNRLLELLLDKIINDVGPHARDAVLQDHLKGRLSEVDLINGLIWEEGKKHGIDCMYNKRVCEITEKIQKKLISPSPMNSRELVS